MLIIRLYDIFSVSGKKGRGEKVEEKTPDRKKWSKEKKAPLLC